MPKGKMIGGTLSTFSPISTLKKQNITMKAHSRMKIRIAAVPLCCCGQVLGNENQEHLLQLGALKNLVGS